MGKKLIVVLFFVLASGCATTAQNARNYRVVVDDYLGKPEFQVIYDFGTPTSMVKLPGGVKMLEYKHISRVANFYSWPFTVRQLCTTRFIIGPNHKVVSYKFVGKGCK